MHAGNVSPYSTVLTGWRDHPHALPLLDRV